ncbi:hypothetical protein G6F40_014857 [Rhizopus arrhizus]|nr:hypothetical protein G6F40_014857 [Rhizopus arrhizus]
MQQAMQQAREGKGEQDGKPVPGSEGTTPRQREEQQAVEASSWKTNAGRGKGDDAGDQHAWALAPAGTGSAAAVAAAAGLGAAARLAGPRSHCNGRYGHPQCRERSGRA